MIPHWQLLLETCQLRTLYLILCPVLFVYAVYLSKTVFWCSVKCLKKCFIYAFTIVIQIIPGLLDRNSFYTGRSNDIKYCIPLMFLLSTSNRSCCALSSRAEVSCKLNPSTVIHLVLFGFLKHSNNIIILLFFCYLSVIQD